MILISERTILFIVIAAFNIKVIFATNQEIVEIIKKYGYPAETHTTESADGYYLTLHRIPHGKNSAKPGFPILAAHGLFSDASQFVRDGNNSLGFFLADKGYDVWLINFRGTHYAKTHKYLTTADRKFWDFSLHEHGIYDLPAYVDYICNHTKNHELFYLGYSMGTTAFSILASERPEYQKRIRGAVLLAPVATMKYSKFPLKVLAAFGSILKVLSDVHSHGEFHIDPEAYKKFVELTCPPNSLISKFCKHAFYVLTAGELAPSDKGSSDRFLNHYPSSTSTKVLAHYSQLIHSGKFRQYDYGILQNLIMYNHKFPPEYHLEAITVPISIFVAPDDILGTPKGVKETIIALPSVQTIYVVPDAHFGQGNFNPGEAYKEVLYPEIARQIENIIRGGNALQEVSLINHFKKVHGTGDHHAENAFNATLTKTHGNENYHAENAFNNTPIRVNDNNTPKELSLSNHFKKVHGTGDHHTENSLNETSTKTHGSENFHTENAFNHTPIQVHNNNASQELSLNNHFKKVHGSELYPAENSLNHTPAQVHGSEKNPLEDSYINNLKKVFANDNFPMADFFVHAPAHVHGNEKAPEEHSYIKNLKKIFANDNFPTVDSFINAPAHIHGSEKVPEEHSYISNLKKVYAKDNFPMVDSFVYGPAHVHGNGNDPEEHSSTHTHRKAHNKKHDHTIRSLINNFSHGEKNDPQEHYTTLLHYIY